MSEKLGGVDHVLIAYIGVEVAAAALQRGWRSQVRRKWSVRDRPVWESGVDDYEWKLLPTWDSDTSCSARDAEGLVRTVRVESEEGLYYVLSYESGLGTFALLHDAGEDNMDLPWRATATTQLQAPLPPMAEAFEDQGPSSRSNRLRHQLLAVTGRYAAIRFSYT